MKTKISLFRYLTVIVTALIITLGLAFFALYAFSEYKNFTHMSEKIKKDSIKNIKTQLKEDVVLFAKSLHVQRKIYLQAQKKELERRVELLGAIVKQSLKNSQVSSKEFDSVVKPLLAQAEQLQIRDSKNSTLFFQTKPFNSLKSLFCQSYKLSKKNIQLQLCVPKRVLEESAQKKVISYTEEIQKEKNSNYFFVGNWEGVSQTFPAKGKNMINIQDKNGVFLVQELIKKAKNGGGFVRYVMPPLEEGLKNTEKLSYTEPINIWEWYVGAGVLIEDVDSQIALLEETMLSKMKKTLFLTLFIGFFIIGAFYFLIAKTQTRVKKDFDIFKGFLQKLVKSNEPIDENNIRYKEFGEIAIHANKMLHEKIVLEKRLDLYRLIVNTIGDFMSFVDRDYKYLAVNETYSKFFGKRRDEIEGMSARELFGDFIFESRIKPLNDRVLGGESFTQEVVVRDKDNKERRLQSTYFPYYEEGDSHPKAFVLYSRDITQQQKAKEQLGLWEKVFAKTSEAVVIMDAQKRITQVNKAFTAISGYSFEDVQHKAFDYICAQSDYKQFLGKSLLEKGYWIGEVENRRKNGENYPALLNTNIIRDEDDTVTNYVAIFTDITKMKKSQKQLQFLAQHDILTKLPNRLLLNDRTHQAIESAKRNKKGFCVCFMDLDNFKKINDSYGHNYGDEVLKQVAGRILSSLRAVDTISRIGGDEFVLLLEEIESEEEVALVMNKLEEALQQAFVVEEKKFFLTASIGVCIYPQHGSSVEELFKNADIAMYKAKDTGKNTYSFFTEQMSIDSFMQVSLEEELKDAINKKEFLLYYQPQLNLKDGSLVGLEALIRWNHPKEGILSPGLFIDFAESSRMIIPIGEFVLQQACADIKKLRKQYDYKGRISINVSGVQIEYGDFFESLNKVIKECGVNPDMIELEITESVFMSDPEHWINLLESIKKTGVNIAIDDFGTGYSSLSYLKELPIDKLKIDMSFVKDIPYDKGACSIVHSVIDLAKNMNLTTLAEGIESKEQEEFLKTNACLEGQGYLYSKPLDFETLLAWLDRRS